MTSKNFELKNPESGDEVRCRCVAAPSGPTCSISPSSTAIRAFSPSIPRFAATATCESKITYIDGDAGVLLYRGYPVEQLAEKEQFHGSGLPADLRRTAERQAAARVLTAASAATP